MLFNIKSIYCQSILICHKEHKRKKNYGELSQVQKKKEEGLDANRQFCVTERFV